jgi:NADH-quinone oxidoreductase subunit L
LHATAHWPKSQAPYYLMMAGVVLTALYMTRQMIYVFYGARRWDLDVQSGHSPVSRPRSIHESPSVMTLPLIVLAICAVGLSAVLTPAWPWLHGYLSGEPVQSDLAGLIQPMLFISLALVAAGIGFGILIYRRAGLTDPFQEGQPELFGFLENKMWLDELYRRTVVALSKAAALVSDWMDRYIWDGLVRAAGGIGQLFGTFAAGFDERGINAGVDEGVTSARSVGRAMGRWHSGQVQTYLAVLAVGVLALLLFYAWLT